MKKLLNGILEFREKHLSKYQQDFAHLALGQAPDALFIACSDSRVVPNLFASTNPGDLFVIRNVGNLVPPHTLMENQTVMAEAAAIEFSLQNLPIQNIIVCGHSDCGAMQAILGGVEKMENGHLKQWLTHCTCSKSHDATLHPSGPLALHNLLSQKNILQQMEHLKSYPLIAQKLANGTIKIHGWYFDIATGDVYAYEEEMHQFICIDEVECKRILNRLE